MYVKVHFELMKCINDQLSRLISMLAEAQWQRQRRLVHHHGITLQNIHVSIPILVHHYDITLQMNVSIPLDPRSKHFCT